MTFYVRNMKRNWRNLKCGICQTNKYLEIKWKNAVSRENLERYTYVKCKKCQLVFMSPRYLPKQTPSFYELKNYWDSELRNFKKDSDFNNKRKEAYGHLYKEIFQNKEKGSILDVGSGTGLFLSFFKERGWEVLGIEVSEEILNFSNKTFGLNVLLGDLLSLKLPSKYFDVICFNNVLEHLHTPRRTLLKVRKILKDDGILEITVPNIESLGGKIFKEKWYHLDPGHHLYLFSEKTISKLLKETGFLVKKTSHSYWIHNFSGLFESLRYKFSPKYTEGITRKLPVKELKKNKLNHFLQEIGKGTAKILSFLGCIIEPVIKRGEVITIYAEKC